MVSITSRDVDDLPSFGSKVDEMDLYADAIRDLSPAEKLLLVERIWDDLAAEGGALPLPEWAVREARRRHDEMVADPQLGATHEDVWTRIQASRNG
jgi:putative addiction module component (TIGR02574 family)